MRCLTPGAACGRRRDSNTYSALNAVAGHYNNFGTKYPLPAKRAERALKARSQNACLHARTHAHRLTHERLYLSYAQELSDAELLLERGR